MNIEQQKTVVLRIMNVALMKFSLVPCGLKHTPFFLRYCSSEVFQIQICHKELYIKNISADRFSEVGTQMSECLMGQRNIADVRHSNVFSPWRKKHELTEAQKLFNCKSDGRLDKTNICENIPLIQKPSPHDIYLSRKLLNLLVNQFSYLDFISQAY